MNSRLACIFVAAVVAVAAAGSQPDVARAAIGPLQVIHGPDADIVEFSDADISEDGTGGAVFVKSDDEGIRHVYASIYRAGSWSAPQQVDRFQEFDSFQPRIGAGDGGRLVVTWIQRGPASDDPAKPRHDRLFSATLDPGVSAFELPVPIDLDVGQQDVSFPDVSMNRDGQAYIVYRVATRISGPDIPPGYMDVDLRAARYNGWTWSRLDQLLDRTTSRLVRQPSLDNAPMVQTDRYGNAMVAFQEPDDDFVDRIWVRRVFGSTLALPLLASPTTFNGQQLRGAADRPNLATGPFGNAVVSFRQSPDPSNSALDRTRLFANLLPDLFTPTATVFAGAVPIDTGAAAGSSSLTGHATAVTTRQKFISVFGVDDVARATEGTDQGLQPEATLGPASPVLTQPGVALAEDDGRAMAWIRGSGVDQSVEVTERNSEGAGTTSTFVSAQGGAVETLRFAGTTNADALVAFKQGTAANSTIVASVVDARPGGFIVIEPEGWLRARRPSLEWEAAFDTGTVSYEVLVDGKLVGHLRGRSLNLGSKIRDGRRTVKVVAVDPLGQRREAIPIVLRLDRKAPTARVRRVKSGVVRVQVSDGRRGRVSGVSSRTTIAWGDGKRSRSRGKSTHRYKSKSGRVKLVIKTRDRAGNRRTYRRWIRL